MALNYLALDVTQEIYEASSLVKVHVVIAALMLFSIFLSSI